jgi:hypothetical protein
MNLMREWRVAASRERDEAWQVPVQETQGVTVFGPATRVDAQLYRRGDGQKGQKVCHGRPDDKGMHAKVTEEEDILVHGGTCYLIQKLHTDVPSPVGDR